MACLKLGNSRSQNEHFAFFPLFDKSHCPCCIFSIVALAFKYSCKWMEEARGVGVKERKARGGGREEKGKESGKEPRHHAVVGAAPLLEFPVEG